MIKLYEEFNDLYKLHRAAVELKHGIYSRGWRLFEPSKFIYSFFAFNSFYSINWRESQIQEELINWESQDMSEPKKIRKMVRYVFNYYVKNGLNKTDEKDAKRKLGEKFITKINEYLGAELKDKVAILNNIVEDNRIEKKEKEKFIGRIRELVDESSLSKKIWDDILYFIYLVRNNVFHGSKDITQMSGIKQIERFKIYTAILLATNEMLFDVIEDNFQWVSEDRNRVRELQKKRISLDETVYSKYKIEVPDGILFYPCCGDDTSEPIKLFIDKISEFHCVDISHIPRLPILECDTNWRNRQILSQHQIELIRMIPSTIIKSIRMYRSESRVVDAKVLEQLEELGIKSTGDRIRAITTRKEEWGYAPKEGRKIQIYRHKQDGLFKFMELDKIAVFFLRGDSPGEGGSGQKWFQPKIFDLIINKLVDGGLIVTDGSGLDYETSDYVPWRPLWERKGESWNAILKKPIDFKYKNRKFTCIGECGYRYGTVYLWKVEQL